jgi:hypothetical protein
MFTNLNFNHLDLSYLAFLYLIVTITRDMTLSLGAKFDTFDIYMYVYLAKEISCFTSNISRVRHMSIFRKKKKSGNKLIPRKH